MTLSRRSFVSRSSFLLAGTAFLPGSGFSAFAGSASHLALPLSENDLTVIEWIRTYASDLRIVGSGVLGKIRQSPRAKTHILARVADLSVLGAALAAPLPFGGATVYAVGNTFTVRFGGTDFTIENLLSEAFDAALAALASRKRIGFASDSLSWDPATGTLSDPFRSAGHPRLRLVNPGSGAASIFATMLRSYVEADSANVTFDLTVSTFWKRVLALSGSGRFAAGPITDELIRQLPQLTDLRTTQQITALLSSHIVRSALRTHLQIDTHSVVAQFPTLRANTPASISDAGIWLSLLLAPQIQAGTASAWSAGLESSRQGRFLTALTEAQAILQPI